MLSIVMVPPPAFRLYDVPPSSRMAPTDECLDTSGAHIRELDERLVVEL